MLEEDMFPTREFLTNLRELTIWIDEKLRLENGVLELNASDDQIIVRVKASTGQEGSMIWKGILRPNENNFSEVLATLQRFVS